MANLDPNLLAYLQYSMVSGADPSKVIEMQANYLRLLASLYGQQSTQTSLPVGSAGMNLGFQSNIPALDILRLQQEAYNHPPTTPSQHYTSQPSSAQFCSPTYQPSDIDKSYDFTQNESFPRHFKYEPTYTRPTNNYESLQVDTKEIKEELISPVQPVVSQIRPRPESPRLNQRRIYQEVDTEDKEEEPEKVNNYAKEEVPEKAVKYIPPVTRGRSIEDVPVKGVQKSFEELLEEEMKKQEALEGSRDSAQAKHDFLKRRSKTVSVSSSEKPKKLPKVQAVEKTKEGKEKNIRDKMKETRKERYSTEEDVPEEDNKLPKPIKPFLKKGKGQLCMARNSAEEAVQTAQSSINTSGVMKRSETHNQIISKRLNESIDYDQESLEEIPNEEEKHGLKSKIQELSEEINRYKNENSKLNKLAKELEGKKKLLDREFQEFQAQKEREIAELDKWKKDEVSKLHRERKLVERSNKLIPNKQKDQKEEIDLLKLTVKKLEDTLKLKDTKHIAAVDKYMKEITELKRRNQQLEQLTKGAEVSTPRIVVTEPKEDTFRSMKSESSSLSSRSSRKDSPKQSTKKTPTREYSLEDHEKSTKVKSEIQTEDGKIQKLYEDGRKEIIFNNGVRREVYPDGYTVVYFTNNDIKQTFPDGKVVYYFASAKTTQTTFTDGMQVFKFSNGQLEKHFIDGTKEINFPDGTVKCIFPDGEEESIFPDGTVQKVDANGVKFIDFVNGQKDTIFPDGTKIREFQDGRVRKILPDGRIIDH